jgi:hypothetical protein
VELFGVQVCDFFEAIKGQVESSWVQRSAVQSVSE